ncbi:hypothetical protein LTS03_009541 [Exophiala xenobiotica]|nr:hypothetical protein LTS06_008639 [Exophiala xenobiotica]KAK5363812.1 hypothetical protein LTS03_009541 [Exophiala xenobiotica]
MESHSLERASKYLNNLLLTRGLLSNGKPIDFAHPDRRGHGTDATMSRVINLVHDLVLRRDQDAEERDNMAMNIRKARAEESQRLLDLQRLQDKNAELVREAASAESQERLLKNAVRKAEAQAKELKEQMLRMKSTLDQVRAKCLSDVRKRDVELDKLKAHLAGMQRGKREASGMKINVINFEQERTGREMRNGQEVKGSEWSLANETNDLLAALVNETSTENVSLRKMIMDTMETLRDLTGLEESDADCQRDEEHEDGIGIPGKYRKSRRKPGPQLDNLSSCTVLAEQMSAILEHCRSILKDPSFVPIEEVQIRDEEIIKLRVGWEKMATRWKEAVTMMDNWRRRTVGHEGDVSSPDLSSLEFGKSMAMLPDGQPVFGIDNELSSVLYDNAKLEEIAEEEAGDADSHGQMNNTQEEAQSESDLDIPLEPAPKRRSPIARRAGLDIGKPIRPLQAIDQNLTLSPIRGAKSKSQVRESSDSGFGSSDHLDNENRAYVDSEISHQIIRQESLDLTVSEKLAAVEAEAAEAQQQDFPRTNKRKHGEVKKSRKATRRRSTLSPDELAELMGIT